MNVSDAILVGEGWISEHYFTTEATKESFRAKVLERRARWDDEAKENRATPRSRFTDARKELEADLATLTELLDPTVTADPGDGSSVDALADSVHARLRTTLGLDAPGLVRDDHGPLTRVSAAGVTGHAPLVVISARPVAAVEELLTKDTPTLPDPVQLDDDAEEIKSVARLLSTLFVADDAPDLALVLAGRWALLAERERWAEGRYLAVDVQLVCERNDTKKGGEIDRALTCLSAESIAPDADGELWWHTVLAASVKHTVGVSQDLRDGVRLSIEIVANEVVARRRAQNLPPLPKDQAQPLARQSLRFLYRILFLLYAEASPELGVLPVGAPEYDQGYSLDRLRELVQVELATPRARSGTHLYESLGVLFRLVEQGNIPADDGEDSTTTPGLTFNPLRADLFRPEATAHIDEVGLGNTAVQQVLAHLLLSKEQRGKDRGFISYAELGINQLGAVYEGLMSYTGFFADTDLYEVAKNGDASKGSWVVPVERAEGIAAADFVKTTDPVTGEPRPVLHQRGSFVFRLAGRERQQSASYYTPEVLTRFTVGQALEELLTDDTPAEDILRMTICEPALGSGAFAIEAVRQLADQYLKRRQRELDQRIDPDEYPKRLQEVKAYLALHNVYGVDLNDTAVELAEISLWLDTMGEGLSAPWFGLHLRRGNSLIGARRAVYRRSQVADKTWLGATPEEVPLTSLVADIEAERVATGGIHHFLLPADGWGSAADAKEAADLAPKAAQRLKAWRKATKNKPTKQTVDAYAELAHRVETLWQIAYRRLSIAEQEIRRSIPVWGTDTLPAGGEVQREKIEKALADEEGAYRRLRRAMDAWTALWFWPLTDATATVDGKVVEPPTITQWIEGLQALLGRNPDLRKRKPAGPTLGNSIGWDELDAAECLELAFAAAKQIKVVLDEHPWLVVCERIAQRQGFFHWNLDFAAVFGCGGFDLQVGNPPWVRPDWNSGAALAEFDPRWTLGADSACSTPLRDVNNFNPDEFEEYGTQLGSTLAVRAMVSHPSLYPGLQGLRPDLYRCFMSQVWRNSRVDGISGLLHPETHFTDENAGQLRKATYQRLRRHWQFQNELRLFDRHNHVSFGVHIYGSHAAEPNFLQASSIYHPATIVRSFAHNGEGPQPGIKDGDGNWDLSPHRARITRVSIKTLRTWHDLLEGGDDIHCARMVYAVNAATAAVLDKLVATQRLGATNLQHSLGWDQTAAENRGIIAKRWGVPDSWDDAILQGPHFWVGTPVFKVPNSSMRSNKDWSNLDLETMPADFVPATSYKPATGRNEFVESFAHWRLADKSISSLGHFRLAWRSMADPANERTLIATIIPPGATYLTQSVYAAGLPNGHKRDLVDAAGWLASLISDFFVRAAPKSSIPRSIINSIPHVQRGFLTTELILRTLRLNCVTAAYSGLWGDVFDEEMRSCSWTGGIEYETRRPLADVGPHWDSGVPLRVACDRRQALVEIDALVALMLGLTAEELCTIYRTQFAVLHGYDRKANFYDVNGRLVPNSVLKVWRKKGDRITEEERTATNQAGFTYTYELPFVTLDREADMRQAYEHFEQRLRERS